MVIFFFRRDIAGINAMVILRPNNVTEYVQRRANIVGLPRKLKRNIVEQLKMDVQDVAGNEVSSSTGSRRRSCKICPTIKMRKSKALGI